MARPAASESAEPRRFGARLTTSRASVPAHWSVPAGPAVAMTDAERRWLQAWRAMSPEEQAVAARMVGGLTGVRVAHRPGTADNRPTVPTHARVRAFAQEPDPDEASMAAAQ